MSLPYRHPFLGNLDIDEVIQSAEGLSGNDGEDALGEIDFLIARFDRIAADRIRSREYKRRSNTVTSGFRRHQRRGIAS